MTAVAKLHLPVAHLINRHGAPLSKLGEWAFGLPETDTVSNSNTYPISRVDSAIRREWSCRSLMAQGRQPAWLIGDCRVQAPFLPRPLDLLSLGSALQLLLLRKSKPKAPRFLRGLYHEGFWSWGKLLWGRAPSSLYLRAK